MRTVHERILLSHEVTFEIVQGDITKEMVDAIVNPANERLQHGGGLARTIVQRGGQIIQQESDDWIRTHGPVTHQKPAVTGCGRLACRHIIHAVGPVWGSGDEDSKLRQAVWGALWQADQLGLASLALPAISTGVFGFPKERAARIIFQTITAWCSTVDTSLGYIALVLYDDETVQQFLTVWHGAR